MSAGLIAVGQFANLEITTDKLTADYSGKAPAIAKMHVVAKEQTIQAVVEFLAELTAVYTRLAIKRVALIAEKQRLERLNERFQMLSRERDRTVELMKEHNLAGAQDSARWSVLQANFEFEQQNASQAGDECHYGKGSVSRTAGRCPRVRCRGG